MREFSLTFVIALVLVKGDRPASIEQHQPIPVVKNTGWKHEKENMQDELLGSWRNRDEHPRLGSIGRVARSEEDLETMCDCFRGLALLSTCSSLLKVRFAFLSLKEQLQTYRFSIIYN